jgi:hypothetical protein
VRQWALLNKHGVSASAWLDNHKDLACLVMEGDDVEAVLAAKGSWSTVAPAITRLTASSKIGLSLFDFAARIVASQSFTVHVQRTLAEVRRSKFSAAVVLAFRQSCEAQALQLRLRADLSAKREVEIIVLNMRVKVEVPDAMAEAELRLAAAIKHAALGKKDGLPLLSYERFLVTPEGDQECEVPFEVVKDMLSARRIAQDLLEQVGTTCLADMQRALSSAASTLQDLDRSFKIEGEFLANSAEQALGDAARARVLQALPSAERHVPMEQASAELADLRKSDLAQVAPLKAQADVDCVRDLVLRLQVHISPKASFADGGPFYVRVLNSLSYFNVHTLEKPGADGQLGNSTIRGAPALQAMWDEFEVTFQNKPAEITAKDLEVFQRNKWLLNDCQLQTLSQWVKAVLKNIGGAGKQSAESSVCPSAAPAAASSSTDPHGSSNSRKAALLKFFGH